MENNKKSFFIKFKDAITNFDEYTNFAEEKTFTVIKYILKLMVIFCIIISIFLTIRTYKEINNLKYIVKNELPEFKIDDNNLVIESQNKQYIKEYLDSSFALIVDSENTEITEEQKTKYARSIFVLKDKVGFISNGIMSEVAYKEINNEHNINGLTKQDLLDSINTKLMAEMFIPFFMITFLIMYITYASQILFDIVLMSVVALIMSKFIGLNLKYKIAFNISAYSLTLSIVLLAIYMGINIFTGFSVKYFNIAYELIAYIYIITALFMIKSDLIKQQIEVGKIVKEQEKVREEFKNKEKQDNKDTKKDNKKNKEKKEKQEKDDNKGEAPEGTNA